MKKNPWKGLVSYEEKDLDSYQFCGRTKAISKYYSLITGNLISTLYGRTGCGKTSMLQAGIFPLLRQESYFPVICRLSLRNEKSSFANYLIECVEKEIISQGFSCTESSVTINQVDDLEKYQLWKYFYGHEFHGKDNNVVFPVIVLDQFEEVLINSKDDSLKFLEQVSFLVGDDLLLPEDCYANFRVTISLREDFLYLLEDAIDEGKLQGLRDNRMRLTPLSIEEAEEVISLGDDFFKNTDREEIYKNICNLAKSQRGHISTNMLSLICSQIYHLYSLKYGKELVTVDDMRRLSEDPLRFFYMNSIKGLNKGTITFIEKNLVLNGFRRPVTKREFENIVPDSDRKSLTTGETKILQFITANDNDCVELIHDTLARTIFGVTKEKKKKSNSYRLIEFSIETLFCIVASVAIVFEVIVKGFSYGVAVCSIIVVIINWLYLVATFGNKNVSKIHFVCLWQFNIYFILFAIGVGLIELEEVDSYVVQMPIYMLLIFLGIFPINNLIWQHRSEVKMGFWKSFKSVFCFETIREEDNKIIDYLRPLSLAVVIGVGALSGFFLSSWCLWLLLPIGTAISYYVINYIIGVNTPSGDLRPYVYPVILSIAFVFVQHIATNHVILTYIVILLFLIWSVNSAIQHKRVTIIRKLAYSFSLFFLCSLILPMLYLGYNPLSKEFKHNARNWSQPKINSAIAVPLLAFHNKDGLTGLADRHQIIFDAEFMNVDSLNYEFFEWENLKKYLDYNLLSGYLKNKNVQNNLDITLHTETGNFKWKDRFSSRGNSLYLATRIDKLEQSPCSKWTEEEFRNIAELAAAYRIKGRDSAANSLEVLYFLRRMIQAEVYQNVETNFSTSATTCEHIIDYYLHKRVDPEFKGDYTQLFIDNADSSENLKRRINHYLNIADGGFTIEYKAQLQSLKEKVESNIKDNTLSSREKNRTYMSFKNSLKEKEINTTIGLLSKISTEHLLNLLDSYKESPFKWRGQMSDESSDMLFQTRNTWGRYVVDSIYTAVYEDKYRDDGAYYNSLAWYNLFLCRFAIAERFARKAIKYAKEDKDYITYTNLITSLFLQGKTAESIDLLRQMKDFVFGKENADWIQLLFPIQADCWEISVGEGVRQDFNHFIRVGLLNDSTAMEFRDLKKILSLEYSLISDQGHFVYSNGWNLSVIPDSLYHFYKNEKEKLPLIKSFDINVKDSVAICLMDTGGYRFLSLPNMQFIGETYDYVWHFSEGLAAVEKDDLLGFINRQGQIEIPIKYPAEEWLHNDHYRLSFRNGKAAVTDSRKFYKLIDKDGIWLWNESFPYVKWYGNGMIVGGLKNKIWTYADAEGNIRGEFDSELDGLLINPISKSYIPIFNHFNVSGIKHADDVPNLDISGIWYCQSEKSFVYFGKDNSEYMWLGKKTDSGSYYLSGEDDAYKIHTISDVLNTQDVVVFDSEVILIGHRLLKKIRSL